MSSLKSRVLILRKTHARCSLSLRKKASFFWKHCTIGRLHGSLLHVSALTPRSFHPANRRMKAIVDSGELGTLTKIEATFCIPGFIVKDNDIRMVYDLGGGAMMDLGCEFLTGLSQGGWLSLSCCSRRLHHVCLALFRQCRSHKGHQRQC
jgi:hypothetical protein